MMSTHTFGQEIKSFGFWLQRLAAHPCCWLPLATGGSVRLMNTNNHILELLIGFVIVILIEECVRAVHNHHTKKCCQKGFHSSRLVSYSIAIPLFLISFALAHYFYPHGAEGLLHDHSHQH